VTNHLNDGEKRNDFPKNYNIYSHYSDPFNFIPVPAEWFVGNSKKDRLNTSDVFTYDVTEHLNGMSISIIDLPSNHIAFTGSKSGYGEIRFFGETILIGIQYGVEQENEIICGLEVLRDGKNSRDEYRKEEWLKNVELQRVLRLHLTSEIWTWKRQQTREFSNKLMELYQSLPLLSDQK
jgi:hypothetical protein